MPVQLRSFPTALRMIVWDRQLERTAAATRVGVSVTQWQRWLDGADLPNDEQLNRIASSLQLSPEEREQLVYSRDQVGLGHRDGNDTRQVGRVVSTDQGTLFVPTGDNILEEKLANVASELEATRRDVQQISTRMEDPQQTNQIQGMLLQVTNRLEELELRLSDTRVAEMGISAPVALPTPEQMKVTLVTSVSLDRLEEYQNDESILLFFASMFGGALLGIFINVATGGVMKAEATTMVWILLIATVVLAALAVNARLRASRLKAGIRGVEHKSLIDDLLRRRSR